MAEEGRETMEIKCLCGRTHLVVVKWERPMLIINANMGQPREGVDG